jgi:hypothetical protein
MAYFPNRQSLLSGHFGRLNWQERVPRLVGLTSMTEGNGLPHFDAGMLPEGPMDEPRRHRRA